MGAKQSKKQGEVIKPIQNGQDPNSASGIGQGIEGAQSNQRNMNNNNTNFN